MEIIGSEIVGVPVISASGDLDHEAKHAVMGMLDRLFHVPDPPTKLLFDLTHCAFIDSGGITVLLSMLDRLPAEGWLGIVGVSSGPGRALMYTGFLDLKRVRFYSSVDEAAVAVVAERELARAQERVDRAEARRNSARQEGSGGRVI